MCRYALSNHQGMRMTEGTGVASCHAARAPFEPSGGSGCAGQRSLPQRALVGH
jgi:hypothetical protein